ncbi:MAG: FMN-binding protein [[Clostridium] scindens]
MRGFQRRWRRRTDRCLSGATITSRAVTGAVNAASDIIRMHFRR